jgi:hypothetical protein
MPIASYTLAARNSAKLQKLGNPTIQHVNECFYGQFGSFHTCAR